MVGTLLRDIPVFGEPVWLKLGVKTPSGNPTLGVGYRKGLSIAGHPRKRHLRGTKRGSWLSSR